MVAARPAVHPPQTTPQTAAQGDRLTPTEIESLENEMRRDGQWMKEELARSGVKVPLGKSNP